MTPTSSLRLALIAAAAALAAASAAEAAGPLQFYSLTPCRLVDTRNPVGPAGGPAIASNSARSFPIFGSCCVPATAKAVALNVTVVTPTQFGFLTIWPSGTPQPVVSTLNFTAADGAVPNGAIVPLSSDPSAQLSVFLGTASPGIAHLLLDVTGYFQ